MKIECKLIRKGGTRATIDGIEYHFAPQADGRHIADVTNKEHAERFLALPRAYQAVQEKAKAEPKPEPVKIEDAPTQDAGETTNDQTNDAQDDEPAPVRRRSRATKDKGEQ